MKKRMDSEFLKIHTTMRSQGVSFGNKKGMSNISIYRVSFMKDL